MEKNTTDTSVFLANAEIQLSFFFIKAVFILPVKTAGETR